MKWAVENMLANTFVSDVDQLGPAIKETIQYSQIRGEFNGICQILKKQGYAKILVTDTGFKFISERDGK